MDSRITLSALKLIGLVFTLQAIRSAIIPESVRPEAAPKTNPSDPRTGSNPSPQPSTSPAGASTPSPSGAGPQAIAQPGTRQNEASGGQQARGTGDAGSQGGSGTSA